MRFETLTRFSTATSRWNGRVAAALRHGDECVTDGRAMPVSSPGEPDDEEWAKRLVFGSSETVVEILKSLEQAGISHVICHFDFSSMPQAEIIASMERFAEDVMSRC